MDRLITLLSTVCHDSVATFNVLRLSNFSSSDHHVAQQFFVSFSFLNVSKRSKLSGLGEHNKVGGGTWVLGREDNYFVVLVDNLYFHLAFDDFVEGRVSELLQSHLNFCYLGLCLANFRLGSPLAHCEGVACLAKLSKDQIGVFVETLQFLA